jgi:hypothetical protein
MLGERDVAEGIQQQILERVQFESPAILERFERFMRRQRMQAIENAAEILERFSRGEDRRRRLDQASLATLPVLVGIAGGSLFVHHMIALHVLVWGSTFAAMLAAVRAWLRKEMGYLGRRDLERQTMAEDHPAGSA